MTREMLIKQTLSAISKLPQEKINEIADFTNYILKKHEEELIQKGVQQLISDSKAFSFLSAEEEIYTIEDLKERYK